MGDVFLNNVESDLCGLITISKLPDIRPTYQEKSLDDKIKVRLCWLWAVMQYLCKLLFFLPCLIIPKRLVYNWIAKEYSYIII